MKRKISNRAELPRLGRRSAELADIVRRSITRGEVSEGGFLSSEREFAAVHGVNKKTVRRALKALENEGLVEAVDRHGYRVAVGVDDRDRGCPIAYIPAEQSDVSKWSLPASLLVPALQEAANRRGLSLLAVGARDRTSKAILAEIRRMRVSGIVIDSDEPELLQEVRDSGITTVMVDQWVEDGFCDSVMQNAQMGGMQAVRYLVGQGCRRIAWLGSSEPSIHRVDRYSGFVSGMIAAGLPIRPEDILGCEADEAVSVARQLLSRKDRPDGIVTSWQHATKAVVDAARVLSLKPGKDLHAVGWCPEEAFSTFYRNQFAGGPVPPAVTWSAQVMAEVAMARLAERRKNPQYPPMRLLIPTKLMCE